MSSGTLSSVTRNGVADADWTLASAAANKLVTQKNTGAQSLSENDRYIFVFASITNHSSGSNCNITNSSSETCYLWINGYSSISETGAQDSTVVSITAVAAVQVTARVDPTFTFVVTGVGASTVNNAITTTVSSAYNTLPFGNLTAGTPRYAAHKLNVTTNTQAGYSVTAEMVTQMAGVYSANNIDPFAYGGVDWGSPAAWTNPGGNSPNTNTAWIGANTTDADISSGAYTNGIFGPISGTANAVMSSAQSDNGSTSIYVTYAVEANVYQPADSYTGTLFYNALPTY
jgi:hypothetical protein